MQKIQKSEESKVTFVAPMFKDYTGVYSYIGSLLSQTNSSWKTIIYHNGTDKLARSIVESFKDSRIVYVESLINTEAWGCYNRIDALNNLIDTEYVIQSSAHDYWIPTAVEEMTNHNEDFLYFNGINHIFGYGGIIDTHPSIGRMDWGNFRVRTEIARKVGINKPEEFCADGMFVRDLLKSGLIKSIRKINKCLTIHN